MLRGTLWLSPKFSEVLSPAMLFTRESDWKLLMLNHELVIKRGSKIFSESSALLKLNWEITRVSTKNFRIPEIFDF